MILDFCVARLDHHQRTKVSEMYLKLKAGSKGEYNEQLISSFCYPLGPDAQVPKEYMAPEEYSFTLTQGDGSRAQGFCRKFLPPVNRARNGSKLRYPLVLCVVCEASWYAFFFKVLQLLEQLLKATDLLTDYDCKQLPATSYAGMFLTELGRKLSENPQPGDVLRLALPRPLHSTLSVSPPRRAAYGIGTSAAPLAFTDDHIELEVPPDCGLGRNNCGVSIARLMWNIPVPCLLTLIASLLLERRVVLVCQSADTLTAAVNAAAALLYPFQWHHIYLPLVPLCFKDYLTAPMPFLVGLPAQMLPILKSIPMSEITMVDLDLGKCEPAPGSELDDSMLLPWREQLLRALQAVKDNLKSPTEYESNSVVSGIMHQYFLMLIGNYRKFLHEEADNDGSVPASGKSRDKEALRGYGHYFDYQNFIHSHRRNPKAARFLEHLRHSQLMEVFLQEHFKLAKQGYDTDDTFELKVVDYMAKKASRPGGHPTSNRPREGPAPAKPVNPTLKVHDKLRFIRGSSNDDLSTKSMPIPTQMRRTATQPQIDDGTKPMPLGSLSSIDPVKFLGDIDDDDATSEDSSVSGQGYLPRRLSTASLPSYAGDDDQPTNRRNSFSGDSARPTPGESARPASGDSARHSEEPTILSSFAARLKHKIGGFVDELKADMAKEQNPLRMSAPELSRDSVNSQKGSYPHTPTVAAASQAAPANFELHQAQNSSQSAPHKRGSGLSVEGTSVNSSKPHPSQPLPQPQTKQEEPRLSQPIVQPPPDRDLLSFGSVSQIEPPPAAATPQVTDLLDLLSTDHDKPAETTTAPVDAHGSGKQLLSGAYVGFASAMKSFSKKVSHGIDSFATGLDNMAESALAESRPAILQQHGSQPAIATQKQVPPLKPSTSEDLFSPSWLGFSISNSKTTSQPMKAMKTQQPEKPSPAQTGPSSAAIVPSQTPGAPGLVAKAQAVPPGLSTMPPSVPAAAATADWDPFGNLAAPSSAPAAPAVTSARAMAAVAPAAQVPVTNPETDADPFAFLAAMSK